MSEATALALGMALITALASGFAAWLAAKYGVKDVDNKISHVIRQNDTQEQKIDDTRNDMNGKLHKLVETLITAALLKERLDVSEKKVRSEKREDGK